MKTHQGCFGEVPEMQETWIPSLNQGDPLEEEMATHSSFLPGKSHRQRSLAGYSPRRHQESDMTEQLNTNDIQEEVPRGTVFCRGPVMAGASPTSSSHTTGLGNL
ncbi:hypothetical protein R6Z07F_009821 [Ovis aries]